MSDKRIPTDETVPTKTHDIITVDGQNYFVKRKGIIQLLRELITDSPDVEPADPTGTGGRQRERSVMDYVDEAVRGADEDARLR